MPKCQVSLHNGVAGMSRIVPSSKIGTSSCRFHQTNCGDIFTTVLHKLSYDAFIFFEKTQKLASRCIDRREVFLQALKRRQPSRSAQQNFVMLVVTSSEAQLPWHPLPCLRLDGSDRAPSFWPLSLDCSCIQLLLGSPCDELDQQGDPLLIS